jgi:hypothetical protein
MNFQVKSPTHVLALSLLIAGLGLGAASPQDKPVAMASVAVAGAPMLKVLLENDKVRVYEVTFKPGDVAKSQLRPNRVVHYKTSGTLTRIHPDGRTEDRTFTAGQTVWAEAGTYAVRNAGTSTIQLMGIEVK